MIVGKVVGNVVATRKHDQLVGYKLLMIKNTNDENIFVAADNLGAGIEDYVLVSRGGVVQNAVVNAPIDALVVGIIDKEPTIK